MSWHRLFLLLYLAPALAAGGQEALTTVVAVRTLSPEEGAQSKPVRLEAVVTYYHPAWGVMFVHDGQEGICVGIAEEKRPALPYRPGLQVRVEGVSGPGEFLPVVLPVKITVLGPGTLPVYARVSAADLFTPALDARPVEVAAVVKGTSFDDQSLVVDLLVEGWAVRAILPQDEALKQPPWQLVERRVRVQGVAGTHFNDQRQMSGRLLFVQGLESFIPDEAERPVTAAPLLPVDGLLRVDSPLRQRVRVRGRVTHVVAGRGLYLRGEGGSMFVQTAQPITVMRGDEVEAEGYPAVTPFRPSLSALDVQKVGTTALLEPVAFHPADTRHSREQCELVRLQADLLELMRSREAVTLVCRAEGQIFEAQLADSALPTEELMPGMKLGLTGVCEFITTRPLVIPRNATGFRLLLRTPEDIVVLARQPWWNERRALWMLGSLVALALAVGAWAVTLQVMVSAQAGVIRRQSRQQATLEERQRIARDLHDTLEQELVGVTMLLDDTSRRLNGAHPQAGEPLGLARRLLRRARDESRSTIRELRSVALEQRGLPAALEELLRPLAAVSGADFAMEVQGTPLRLAGTLETALLRIAQEAVANAAHHAGALRISVRLEYAVARVCLEVRDDGCGFDPASITVGAGHFGLSGMKERAQKIAGELRILSHPGSGTTIAVSAPLVTSQTPLSSDDA